MPQPGVMILPFRDAADRFAAGPGFLHREPSYACREPIPKSIAVPCTRFAISIRLMIRGNELATVLLWHYGVRWRTPTNGLPGPESGALARISPDDEKWATGLIHRTGVAFTRDVKLVRKATGYEKSRRPTGSGFAGHASRVSRRHSTVSVTHRFL